MYKESASRISVQTAESTQLAKNEYLGKPDPLVENLTFDEPALQSLIKV
jgi:hypothetical protein